MKQKYYGIAIRKKICADDVFWKNMDYSFNEIKIPKSNRYWFADPFPFEYMGKTFIFFEAFDIVRNRGYIGYSVYADGKVSRPHIIIKGNCHMSFPFIFKEDNNVYIMPESSGINKVMTYKADIFPDKWSENSVILNDFFGVDSIRWYDKNNDVTFLLSSEQFKNLTDDKVVSCWVQNVRFLLGNDGKVIDSGVISSQGDYGIRNAGRMFMLDGDVIRCGQDCTNGQYGKGLVFWRVDGNIPYSETEVFHIDGNEMQEHMIYVKDNKKIIGCHTYNSTDSIEVIDFSYLAENSFFTKIGIVMNKLIWKLRGGVRWIFRLSRT